VTGAFRTIGHPTGLTAVRAMLGGQAPHAVLIAGPPAVGKTTLALDLAAGLLCTGARGLDRPCRSCRSCRLVDHGNHPDIHRIAPTGPGGQIVIGGKDRDVRGIRDLIGELALLPVEGGPRIAILESAHRMNDDAQSALLKTLEEPPAGTTLILCADDEDRLFPTVRSRCVTVRVGPVGARDVERIVVERGLADAPTGARLARLTGGRPGLALAYATSPEAEAVRTEIVRTLLDLMSAGRAQRLTAGRGLLARTAELGKLLGPPEVAASATRRGRGAKAAAADEPGPAASADDASQDDAAEAPARTPAADRRRALALLIEIWRDLARDIAVAGTGSASLRETRLLEELEATARSMTPGEATRAVGRLVRASELLDSNVSPELLVDVLAVRWPRIARRVA
jgi:DNA polymerase-3 subunit delta'